MRSVFSWLHHDWSSLIHVGPDSRRFLGTFGSTFSSYISRVRSYHSAALVPDKGVYFTNYPDTPVRHSTLNLTLASIPCLTYPYQMYAPSAHVKTYSLAPNASLTLRRITVGLHKRWDCHFEADPFPAPCSASCVMCMRFSMHAAPCRSIFGPLCTATMVTTEPLPHSVNALHAAGRLRERDQQQRLAGGRRLVEPPRRGALQPRAVDARLRRDHRLPDAPPPAGA